MVVLAFCCPVFAQWIKYPTPGIPRLPDGKPNLSAPAPRTADGKPDLSGIWQTTNGRLLANIGAEGVEIPMRPAAQAIYRERQDNNGKDRPSGRCVSHGLTDFNLLGMPTKIVQTPSVTIILFEAYNHYRQILTDGRPLASRSTAGMARILSRPLGRRHLRRRVQRPELRDVARRWWASAW